MRFFDTHAHLNFLAYDVDRVEVLERIRQADMGVVVPSSQLATSQKAVDLAREYNFIFAAIGIHPIHVFDEEFRPEAYQLLIDSGQVRAIGETGLDYFHIKEKTKPSSEVKAAQEKLFSQQIELALKNDLPLIVHGRYSEEQPEAYQDILKVLLAKKVRQAVIHCYTGQPEDARDFIKAGYYLGFTGIITFDKSGVLKQVVQEAPLEKILIEIDAPYLSPAPYRGKRNEPIYVIEVARKVAEIKGLGLDEVLTATTANAKKLFKI